MKLKQIDIEFTRGDTIPVSFTLLDAEGNVLELQNGDELYATVKKSYSDKNAIIQKKYTAGDIIFEDGKYKFTFLASDTNTLQYGTYVIDICLKSGDFVRTVAIGEITLTDEVTFVNNE